LKHGAILGLDVVMDTDLWLYDTSVYVKLNQKVKATVKKINKRSVSIDLIANNITVFSRLKKLVALSRIKNSRDISLNNISSVRIPFYRNENGNLKVKTKRETQMFDESYWNAK